MGHFSLLLLFVQLFWLVSRFQLPLCANWRASNNASCPDLPQDNIQLLWIAGLVVVCDVRILVSPPTSGYYRTKFSRYFNLHSFILDCIASSEYFHSSIFIQISPSIFFWFTVERIALTFQVEFMNTFTIFES